MDEGCASRCPSLFSTTSFTEKSDDASSCVVSQFTKCTWSEGSSSSRRPRFFRPNNRKLSQDSVSDRGGARSFLVGALRRRGRRQASSLASFV